MIAVCRVQRADAKRPPSQQSVCLAAVLRSQLRAVNVYRGNRQLPSLALDGQGDGIASLEAVRRHFLSPG